MSEPSEQLFIALEPVDLVHYLSVPLLQTAETISLARSLLALTPEDGWETLVAAATALDARVIEGEVALDTLHRLLGKSIRADERIVDIAVDGAWLVARGQLGALKNYDRPGFHHFAAEPDSKVDYSERVALAHRAQELDERIFGAHGVNFLRLSYPEQAEVMASILRIIEEDGLEDELDTLCGHAMTETLRDCQRRYQDMVNRRSARAKLQGNTPNLNIVRERLRRAIRSYCAAFVARLDDDEPEWLALMTRCLQPMISVRKGGRASGSATEATADEAEASPDQQPPPSEDVDADVDAD